MTSAKISPGSWLNGRSLYLCSQLVARTARYRLFEPERVQALEAAGRPIIWTSWHGETMALAGYLMHHYAGAGPRVRFIVPDDWRGETLSEWARLLGATTFTISMKEESLVAARRLLQLVRLIKGGANAFINPDGPSGPSGVPKPGVAFLASKSGAAVLPVGVYTHTRYQLRRWDRYSIPLPFSRITIVFGEPLTVARKEDIQGACDRIAAGINQAMAEAKERHYGGQGNKPPIVPPH